MGKLILKIPNYLIFRGGVLRFVLILVIMNSSFNSFTQITKQQAIDFVMDSIVNNRSDSVNVYMDSIVQSSTYYNLSPFDSIGSAYSYYYLFFIDQNPLYDWGHECSYIIMDTLNGNFTEIEKYKPPFQYKKNMQQVSVPIDFGKLQFDFSIPYVPKQSVNSNCNSYAVLILGDDGGTGYKWSAISHIYCGLLENGYPESNIYVLAYDGTEGEFTNKSLDLDNDGDDDILPIVCNVSNVASIFNDLEENLDYADQLFIQASCHGYNDLNDPDKYYLGLWESELLSNYEFANMLDQISCSSITISLASCFSGGFKEELLGLSKPERVNILTSRNNLQYVRNMHFMQYAMMDTYEYFLITALRGWHPDYINSAPWIRMSKIGENTDFYSLLELIKMDVEPEANFDKTGGNNNGIQEIQESINYTARYCTQFNDYGVKEYDCGFLTEDLQSLKGISGKVESIQTLSGNFLIGGDLSVEPGVELTLSSGSKFHIFDSKITLQVGKDDNENNIHINGGEFIVDNATITNVCDIPWKGIYVIGDINEHQFSFENPKHAMVQGKLLLDGATIENAEVAISLFDRDDEKATRGGIVIAKNSSLTNNQKAVEFREYHNIVKINGVDTEYDYESSFTNCDFLVDNNYLFGSTYNKQSQVKLTGVKGIKFNGVNFINELDTEPYGRAIHTHNAGFILDKGCTNKIQPCNYENSSFNGFLNAVEAGTSGESLYNTYIRNSDFVNNGVGITLHDVDYSIITDNTFTIGWSPACIDNMGKGIYLDNSNSFAIEDNTFNVDNPIGGNIYVGIHTNNTNSAGDEIYNNTFAGMNIANYAEGKNWNEYFETGLAYYCNKNTGSDWDFYVKDYAEDYDGIQKLQGSKSMPAGNEFSSTASWHFDNNGAYEISYFYDNGSAPEIPDAGKLYRVSPLPLTLSSSCPKHYGNGNDIRLSSAEYAQRETDYGSASSSYNSALLSYNAASDSALREYYARQMSYYNTLMDRAAYDIVRSNMADSIVQDSLYVAWQDKLGTYASSEGMVDYYIQKGEYTKAWNTADSLEYNFTFTSYDSTEYPYYMELKELQIEWLKDGRDVFGLTPTEKSKLAVIADSSRGTAGAQARGILSFAYDSLYSYVNCISMPDTSQKSSPVTNGNDNENNGAWVKVSPNPATSAITFSYSIGDKANAALKLYNQNGVLIDEIILEANNSTFIYNCSNYKPGIYYYSATVESSVVKGKFIVVN
ncbi:MAG: T9SS type A sorting domain-containing protein [Chlorobi bacterium]|nr:T9SS type A sorting domain-containing protein [Chlorobiota bacterium]